jgi:glycosyltransferase involved in cell wall biosynthesis
VRVAVWTNLPSGGGQRALYEHVRGLLTYGHEVTVWAPPSADRSMLDLGQLAPYNVVPYPKWTRRFANRAPSHFRLPFRIAAMKQHCRTVCEQVTQAGTDVLLSASCQDFAVSPVARYLSLPSVLYLQEPYRPLYEALPDNPWQLEGGRGERASVSRRLDGFATCQARRLQVREEIISARSFSAILVNSYFSAESVARAYGLQAQVCYLGIDPSDWEGQGPGRREGVIGIGAFERHKRIELVIDALGLIGEQAPSLTWLGHKADDKYLSELRKRAADKNVTFTPRISVTHDELVVSLGRASIFCCTPRLEPFGYGPLEAGAARLPVVAVAEGGLRETVIDNVNGLLAGPAPEPVAEAISALLRDPELRRRLGEGGRALVQERWSLDAATARLERELDRVKTAAAATNPGRPI